jgi:hypothetical protein
MSASTETKPGRGMRAMRFVAPPRPTSLFGGNGRNQDLLRNAWEEGAKNEPRANGTEPNPDEITILSRYQKLHESLDTWVNDRMSWIEGELHPPDVLFPASAVDDIRRSEEVALAAEITKAKPTLSKLYEAKKGCEDEYALMYGEVQRHADYPASMVMHFALLATFILLESLANMSIFARVSQMGLLGGLLQAMLISIMNVGFAAWVGGFLLRGLNYRALFPKLLNAAGLALYLVYVFVFNFVAAHFRNLLTPSTTSVDQALTGAVPSAFSRPFDLGLESWMLLILGLVASFFGMREGFRADDRHPGYGALHRRRKRLQEDYEHEKSLFRDRVLQLSVANVRTTCEQARAGADVLLADLRNVKSTAAALAEDYAGSLADIDRQYREDLGRYRRENVEVRTDPPPRYFSHYESFPKRLDRTRLEPLSRRAEDLLTEGAKFLQELKKLASTGSQREKSAIERFEEMIREIELSVNRGLVSASKSGDGATPVRS